MRLGQRTRERQDPLRPETPGTVTPPPRRPASKLEERQIHHGSVVGMNLAHWSHSQAVWSSRECRGREKSAEAGKAAGQALGRGLEAKFLGFGIPSREQWESPGGFASGEHHDLI